MTDIYHAIVWIDHTQAKIFHVGANAADRTVISSHAGHLQHKANTHGSGHQGVDKEFFKQIVAALSHTGAMLITGPATAKAELKHYIAAHHPELDQRIAGVEALDHPSDAQLIALARKYFDADARMHAK